MDIIQELYPYKGYIIRVSTHDGIYEGVLLNVCPKIRKITLAKVVSVLDLTTQLGNWSFFAKEIKSYDVVSDAARIKHLRDGKKRHLADLEVQRCRTQKLDVVKCIDYLDSNEGDETEASEYILELPDHLSQQLPQDHVIIHDIDNTFYEAIDHINRQTEIGVSFVGDKIGRFGELWIVSISTTYCTILFDVYTLKNDVFQQGLQSILESKEILKVIHDCRQPSDVLFHKYSTKLDNVFDTQVASTFADMQNSKPGPVSKRVQSLSLCLMKYLVLTEKQTSFIKTSQPGTSTWMSYPLPNSLVDAAIKSAIYLQLLKEQLTSEMFRSFNTAVNLYLRVVRNASVKELELQPSSDDLLPEALLSADILTVHIRNEPTDRWTRKHENSVAKLTMQPLKPRGTYYKKLLNVDDMKENKMTQRMERCSLSPAPGFVVPKCAVPPRVVRPTRTPTLNGDRPNSEKDEPVRASPVQKFLRSSHLRLSSGSQKSNKNECRENKPFDWSMLTAERELANHKFYPAGC